MRLIHSDLFELNYLAVAEIKGPDAAKFLQGQTTVDIEKVTDSYSPLGAFCSHQGRIRALFRASVIPHHNADEDLSNSNLGYLLITDASNIEQFLQELKKYAVFFKVEISQRNDYQVYGAFKAPAQIELTHSNSTKQFEQLTIIKNQTTPDSFLVLSQTPLKDINKQPISQWHQREIESGLSNISAELFEKLLPHNIKLPELGGVSFTKGCYTGQEIVARMHYKGNLKHQLYAFSSDANIEIPLNTTILENGKKIGVVIRSTNTEQGASVILVESKKELLLENITADFENQPILTNIPIRLDTTHQASQS
jgi:tRNA-modifying protein YgfZ